MRDQEQVMLICENPSFSVTYDYLLSCLERAPVVETERWQGVKANLTTRELQNVVVEMDLREFEDLDHWRGEIKPNLPWADDHFLERVSGEPMNPGEQWRNWPYITPGAFQRQGNMRFNHSYMERLWSKYARRDGEFVPSRIHIRKYPKEGDLRATWGIAGFYGDLEDLVDLLVKEPYTRQAYIPLFFPEDVGVGDGGRKPCTLGYQIMVRDGRVNMFYPMRSCDMRHHFRDDVYLAVRLLIWVIDQCRQKSTVWTEFRPGSLDMFITSLHEFVR